MKLKIANFIIFFVDYDEMVATMQRLQANFKKHGMHALASRLNIAQNLLLKSVVAKALDTRIQLLQRRFPQVQNPISYNAQKLTKDVSESCELNDKIKLKIIFFLVRGSFVRIKLITSC
jgi:hypothetical protein